MRSSKITMNYIYLFLILQFTTACSNKGGNSQGISPSIDSEQRFILVLPYEYWHPIFPTMQGDVNVFSASWNGSDLRPLFDPIDKYNYVENTSSENGQILFSSSPYPFSVSTEQTPTKLYILDLNEAEPLLISESYLPGVFPYTANVLWQSDSAVIYVGRTENETTLFKTQLESGTTIGILDSETSFAFPPLYLLSASDDDLIYWRNGFITTETSVIENSVWRVRSTGEDLYKMGTKDGTQMPIFSVSPDGSMLILGKDIIDENFNRISTLQVENDPTGLYWSESSKKLFFSVKSCKTSDCTQYQMEYYIWAQETLAPSLTQVHIDTEVNWAMWSPNEEQILLYSFQDAINSRRMLPVVFDLKSGEVLPILTEIEAIGTDDDYYVFWQP